MTELAEELIGAPAEDAAAPVSSAPPNIVTLPDGHHVTLYPEVPTQTAMAVLSVIDQGSPSTAVAMGRLAEVYLDTSIMAWDFRDPKGQLEPVTPENVRRLVTVRNGSVDVAERADNLYREDIQVPLVPRIVKRLQTLRTPDSTSPPSGDGSITPTPLRRSSRNGTAGKRSRR